MKQTALHGLLKILELCERMVFIMSLVLLFIPLFLAASAGFVILQINLSGRKSPLPGLILPVAGLLLIGILGIYALNINSQQSSPTSSAHYDDEGNIDERFEIIEDGADTHHGTASTGVIRLSPFLFVLGIINIILWIILYLARRLSGKSRRDIEKMSIHDL